MLLCLSPDHGPVMLSWMLAHYLIDDDYSRFRNLGERAVQVTIFQSTLQLFLFIRVSFNHLATCFRSVTSLTSFWQHFFKNFRHCKRLNKIFDLRDLQLGAEMGNAETLNV